MELDGSDADGEWSDGSEDLLKSGSATAASDSEGEDTPRIIIKAPRKAGNRKKDATDSLMDKIDKELHIINSSPTPPFTDKQKGYPANPNGTDITVQRVEWNKKGVNGMHPGKGDVNHQSSEREGTDTGLGTCSIHDESPSDLDRVKMYSKTKRNRQTEVRTALEDNNEEDAIMKYGGHSDLDSVAAQQIDEKFQEIMRRKKGGYLDDLKARMQSDAETIMTEDFQDKFRDALIYQSSGSETVELRDPESEGTVTPRSEDVRRQTANTSQHSPGERSSPKLSRTSSVPIQHPVKSERSRTPPSSNQPSTFSLPSFHKITPKQPAGPVQPQRRGYISDVDSIQTEDFEAKFHGLLVKQVAGVPVTCFRTGAVDSDLDSVSGQMVYNKVQKVLKASPYFKEAEASESDPDGPQRLRPPSRRRGRCPSSYRKQAMLNGAGPHGKALRSGPYANYRILPHVVYRPSSESTIYEESTNNSAYDITSSSSLESNISSNWSSFRMSVNGPNCKGMSRQNSLASSRSSSSSISSDPKLSHSNSISMSDSTFDEVESIDFNHHHDVASRSLSTQSDGLPNSDDEKRLFYGMQHLANSSLSQENGGLITPQSGGGIPSAFHSPVKHNLDYIFNHPGMMPLSRVPVATRSSVDTMSSGSIGSLETSGSSNRLSLGTDESYEVRLKRLLKNLSHNSSTESVSRSFQEAEPYAPQPQPATAENVLMSLGFSGTDSFIPSRFAKDWYNKVTVSKSQKMMQSSMAEVSTAGMSPDECKLAEILAGMISTMDSSSITGNPLSMDASSNHGVKQKLFKDKKTFKRAVEILSCMQPFAETYGELSQANRLRTKNAQDVQSQRSTQRVDSSVPHKRSDFATRRQNSLPPNLDMLTEVPTQDTTAENKPVNFLSLICESDSDCQTESDEDNKRRNEVASHYNTWQQKAEDVKVNLSPVRVPCITVEGSRASPQTPKFSHINKADCNNQVQSSDSLEVADIMTENFHCPLAVEPALLSTVLSDFHPEKRRLSDSLRVTGVDRLLSISPASNMSVSPCPLSPVTVIEVGLDNQNDSLDSIHESKSEYGGGSEIHAPKYFSPVREEMASTSDIGVEADDGRDSPLRLLNNDSMFSKYWSHSGQRMETSDANIQADDGSLSPILRLGEYRILSSLLEDSETFYMTSDQSTQWEDDVIAFDKRSENANETDNFIYGSNSGVCKFDEIEENNNALIQHEVKNVQLNRNMLQIDMGTQTTSTQYSCADATCQTSEEKNCFETSPVGNQTTQTEFIRNSDDHDQLSWQLDLPTDIFISCFAGQEKRDKLNQILNRLAERNRIHRTRCKMKNSYNAVNGI